MDPVEVLPIEIVEYIFSYLAPKDLIKCGQVSTCWRFFSTSDNLWRRKCALMKIVGFRDTAKESPLSASPWARYYWESTRRTLSNWVADRSSRWLLQLDSSCRLPSCDGRELALIRGDTVYIHELNGGPILTQTISGQGLATGVLVSSKCLVVRDEFALAFYSKGKEYELVGSWLWNKLTNSYQLPDEPLEPAEIIFLNITPGYLYVVYESSNTINIWSSRSCSLVSQVGVCESAELYSDDLRTYVYEGPVEGVMALEGPFSFRIDVKLHPTRIQSNSSSIAILCRRKKQKVTDDDYLLYVYNLRGERVWVKGLPKPISLTLIRDTSVVVLFQGLGDVHKLVEYLYNGLKSEQVWEVDDLACVRLKHIGGSYIACLTRRNWEMFHDLLLYDLNECRFVYRKDYIATLLIYIDSNYVVTVTGDSVRLDCYKDLAYI